MQLRWIVLEALLPYLIIASYVHASTDTIGENGINSAGLGLTGSGVSVGQIERERPGQPTDLDDSAHSNSGIRPVAVYINDNQGPQPTANSTAELLSPEDQSPHATWVAGVMISQAPDVPGVAPFANLYATARRSFLVADMDQLATQFIAQRDDGKIRAINISYGIPFEPGKALDGNSDFTLFIDWSATVHDVLYVTAGDADYLPFTPQPTDNYNGINVASSSKPMGEAKFSQVAPFNRFNQHPNSTRTLVDILAPGGSQEMATLGNPSFPPFSFGNSFAAPHVTGTVALLQEYAEAQILASTERWSGNARRHQVMKAVLMNSADKLIDNGTVIPPGQTQPVPQGGLLGMERTVLKQDGVSTWFESLAYDDTLHGQGQFDPLDEQMGAGHLNARRALQQFQSGEWNNNADDVPLIGWDYGTITGMSTGLGSVHRYPFNEPLMGSSFVSITLAWDRHVAFENDANMNGEFDSGDTFAPYVDDGINPPDDSVINNLLIYLLPKFAGTRGQAVAASIANVGTVQHIFFQIEDAGEYEFWVWQHDLDVGPSQDYAIAWWAASASLVSQGDFNNDGLIDGEDLVAWQASFGTDAGGDANGDGVTDGADFLIWQRNVGASLAVPATAAVPEPSAALLLAAAAFSLRASRRRGSRL